MPAWCRWAALAAVMCHTSSLPVSPAAHPFRERAPKHLITATASGSCDSWQVRAVPTRGWGPMSPHCVIQTAAWRIAALRWFEATASWEVHVLEGLL